MAIVKRIVKGSALTHTELDGNFTDLDDRLTAADVVAVNSHGHALNANSSGVLSGGALTINGDTTKFDISAGYGDIVDNVTTPNVPTDTPVTWAAKLAVSVTNIATHPVTYVCIDSAGNVVQAVTYPTATERRANIFLGLIVHSNNTTIVATNDLPVVGIDVAAQLYDFMNSFGFRSQSGNFISPNGANLSFDKSAGVGFKAGANFQTLATQPHEFSMAATTLSTFNYRNQDSAEGSAVTLIDPTTYDLNGVTTTVPANNNATLQRVYIFPSNLIRVQRGQEVFATLADALNAAGQEDYIIEPNIGDNALLLGYIVAKKTATDLSDSSQAKFLRVASISGSAASSSFENASVGCSSLADQPMTLANTQYVITCSTDDVPPINITHASGELTFSVAGRYDLTCEAQVHQGSGTTTAYIWAQHSSNSGATWTNVADSAAAQTLASNSEGVLVLGLLHDMAAGDMLRFMMQADGLNAELDFIAAAGNIPAVPSVIIIAHRIG